MKRNAATSEMLTARPASTGTCNRRPTNPNTAAPSANTQYAHGYTPPNAKTPQASKINNAPFQRRIGAVLPMDRGRSALRVWRVSVARNPAGPALGSGRPPHRSIADLDQAPNSFSG